MDKVWTRHGIYLQQSSLAERCLDNGIHKNTTREYSAVKRSIWRINNLPGLTPATILTPNIVKLGRPEKRESIDMVIFLPGFSPRSPSVVNLVNAPERTMIGQHVFT
jgi:hypothetical protein